MRYFTWKLELVSDMLWLAIGIEMFKVLMKASYELWQRSCFHNLSVSTVFSGTESIRFLGPKICELIPNDNKCLENLRDFKIAIKKWKPTWCPVESAKHISMGLDFYNNCL